MKQDISLYMDGRVVPLPMMATPIFSAILTVDSWYFDGSEIPFFYCFPRATTKQRLPQSCRMYFCLFLALHCVSSGPSTFEKTRVGPSLPRAPPPSSLEDTLAAICTRGCLHLASLASSESRVRRLTYDGVNLNKKCFVWGSVMRRGRLWAENEKVWY